MNRYKHNIKYLLVLLIVLPKLDLAAKEIPRFDFRPFRSFEYVTLLCFDLRDDRDVPLTGLLLNTESIPEPTLATLVLPFGVRALVPDRRLWTSWGNFDDYSVINYVWHPTPYREIGLPLTPYMNDLPNRPPSVEQLDPGLYMIKSGLDRWFILMFKMPLRTAKEINKLFSATSIHPPLAVAVALPKGSIGKEISNGQTAYPMPTYSASTMKVFASAESVPLDRIEVRYEVSPTDFQNLVNRFGIKLLGVLIVPFLALLFLRKDEIAKLKTRNLVLAISGLIQIMILAAIVWTAIISGRWRGIELILNVIILTGGATLSGIVIWVKRN